MKQFTMSMYAGRDDMHKAMIEHIRELEIEVAQKSKQIDYILSRCGVNAHGIYIPCGNSKITEDNKAESIKWIKKATDNNGEEG